MQNIVVQPRPTGGGEVPAVVGGVALARQRATSTLDRCGSRSLDAQPKRRIIKSHLPLDVHPLPPGAALHRRGARRARRLHVVLKPQLRAIPRRPTPVNNDPATLHGPPLPRCPADIHVFWDAWINRGWFAGESEGYPHSCEPRLHPVVVLTSATSTTSSLCTSTTCSRTWPVEIGRVARYLGISVGPAEARRLAADLDFAAIKRNAERAAPMPPERAERVFVGGLASFFFKGTNGRWRDVLRPEELAMLEQGEGPGNDPALRRLHGARPRRAPVELRPVSRHVGHGPRPRARPDPDAGPRQRAPADPRVGQLFLGGSIGKSVA